MGKSEKIKRKRRHQSPSESDSSVEDNDETARKRHRKSSHKNFTKEKHTQSVLSDSSTDSSSSSSSSTSDSEDEKRKHHKKRTKKDKKSKHKKKLRKKEKKKKHKKSKKKRKSTALCSPLHAAVPEIKLPKKTRSGETSTAKKTDADSCGRMLKPLTKEEWEKQQAVLHREYDPETGRNRLVRGDGEIVEEIVSKERHKEINKQATAGDGIFYQMKAGLHK